MRSSGGEWGRKGSEHPPLDRPWLEEPTPFTNCHAAPLSSVSTSVKRHQQSYSPHIVEMKGNKLGNHLARCSYRERSISAGGWSFNTAWTRSFSAIVHGTFLSSQRSLLVSVPSRISLARTFFKATNPQLVGALPRPQGSSSGSSPAMGLCKH